MLRMDEINKIRKSYYKDGYNINQIALRFNRSWHTIKNLIEKPREQLTNRGKRPNRECGILTKDVIDAVNGYLDNEETYNVKRKHKYSATFIYHDLKNKGFYNGSARALRGLVKKLRNKRNQNPKRNFLPLDFALGTVLQFDHGEVDCIIDCNRRTRYLFVASVPGAAVRFCQLYECKTKEAWGDFHERAFAFFGGIPPKVVYDNDSVLVKSVIGLEHKQTTFSLSLEEHYGFVSHFCNVASGFEKGAVENAVGYCRRNYFPGCKQFESISEANNYLAISSAKAISEGIHYKTEVPLKVIFDEVSEQLLPLKPAIKWRSWNYNRVDACQLISNDNHQYSVPKQYCGSRLRISVSAFDIEIFDENEQLIARHKRLFELGKDSLLLEHYLEQLQKKPGALRDCKAFNEEGLTSQVKELWRRFKNRYPERKANKELINTLLLFQSYLIEEVTMAIDLALEYNAIEAAAIENIIKQLNEKTTYTNQDVLKSKISNVPLTKFAFDLTIYNTLVEEVNYVG